MKMIQEEMNMAKQKEAAVVPTVVDSVETLEAKMKAMREAQKVFATFTQEQVDKIFFEAAVAANTQRIPLAKMAVEETGMGIVEDKVIKNHYAAEYIYNAYKDTKTCGVIEEDKAYGIKKIAEPIGLIAAVIPTTNPTSTAIFKYIDRIKDKKCNHHQPTSTCKKCDNCSSKSCIGSSCKSWSTRRNHRMDRRTFIRAYKRSNEERRHHSCNRWSWNG